MGAEIWSFLSIVVVPLLGGIVGWVWRLDGRVYEIQKELLTRDEFAASVDKIRSEIHDIRRVLVSGRS